MITRDLRHVIARAVAAAGYRVAAAGYRTAEDPGLRPTGIPGQYAASIALTLAPNPRETARILAAELSRQPWIAAAEVTGPGYLTVTVTPEALGAVAAEVIEAGASCVTSNALAGLAVPAPPPGDPLAAPGWEEARAALAVRLTARLAAAAGATVTEATGAERFRVSPPPAPVTSGGEASTRSGEIEAEVEAEVEAAPDGCSRWPAAGPPGGPAAAVAFAGRDAVTFTLARAIPGKPLRVEPQGIARHVPGNPAYAVRYAHARAASGVRWAAGSPAADTIGAGEELLAALSWLPERVATAARRGRPDEFARYLEDLARVTVDVLSSARPSGPGPANIAMSGSDKLTLATAAQTGLAAGLGLLEVSAPERL